MLKGKRWGMMEFVPFRFGILKNHMVMAGGKKVHLLCSSGGVRCFSYIGALRALTEAGYTVSGVSASSMGSVMGMLICCGLSADSIEEKLLSHPVGRYLRRRFPLPFMEYFAFPFAKYHHPDYHSLLVDFTGSDPVLDELQIPYSSLALDLRSRELLSFSKESHPDMRASELLKIATAIPPLFAPVEMGRSLLVDAGIATESPGWVAFAESGGNPVVVLKCPVLPNSPAGVKFPAFLANMIQSAAAGNDDFSLQQMPNCFVVEINCGNIKAEDFNISPETIRSLVLLGQKAMGQTLGHCSNDLGKFLKVDNISWHSRNPGAGDKARERSISLLQKFRRVNEGRCQVFISYSHKDLVWFNKLQLVLAPIEAFHGIKVWDDKEIEPGEYWHDTIRMALAQTKIALCMVTPDFLASKYITENEFSYLIDESQKQRVRLLLISVSQVDLSASPLRHIQFANNPASPLDTLSEPEQFAVLQGVADDMVRLMQ